MEQINKLILIWGFAVILYLFVANTTGTTSLFQGVTNLFVGGTKALQGR